MKSFTIFLIGLILMVFSYQIALGCQCGPVGPTCSQFSKADAVFIGRVEKVEVPNSLVNNNLSYSIIHFRVEQSFKGTKQTSVKVGYMFGTSCSKSPEAFKENEKWLVYGYKDGDLLTIPLCTGSYSISNQDDDLEFIQNYLKGTTKEFVYGSLVKGVYDPVKNGSVIVSKGNRKFKTRMHEGFFFAKVPGEGIYKVRVVVPFKAELSDIVLKKFSTTKSKTIVEYETKVEKGLCSFENLNFYGSQEKISGLKWNNNNSLESKRLYQFLIN